MEGDHQALDLSGRCGKGAANKGHWTIARIPFQLGFRTLKNVAHRATDRVLPGDKGAGGFCPGPLVKGLAEPINRQASCMFVFLLAPGALNVTMYKNRAAAFSSGFTRPDSTVS